MWSEYSLSVKQSGELMNYLLKCYIIMIVLLCRSSLAFRSVSLRNPKTAPRALFSSTSSSCSDRSDVPLVFLHGMKGSHLSSEVSSRNWLSLQGILNFPPIDPKHPTRDLALPLTYKGTVQDQGDLKVDGLVNHIVDLHESFPLLPFYGHVSKLLDEANASYKIGQPHSDTISRPTACFIYDWRRNLQELSDEFHKFCCDTFPDQPVQVLAHSMGGLISLPALRQHPDKYRPGAVMAGVPFDTGIQFFQDLHLGYTTELGTCRQFSPDTQFTFSSHWCFFPMNPDKMEDSFVDVTENDDHDDSLFEANKPSIGKDVGESFRPDPVKGERIEIDFYNVDDWEKHRIGIFDDMNDLDEKTLDAYRNHMKIQLESARTFRETKLLGAHPDEDVPPLVVLATNTKPTVNQILRRKSEDKGHEFCYTSGRTVPGDGRINFSGAFPPLKHKALELQSFHAKQFLWEDSGGDLRKIMAEVDSQIASYTSSDDSGVVEKRVLESANSAK